ncbi:MAG: Gfo/Idh/MocA family protein [Thermomicrobiales bacterium]
MNVAILGYGSIAEDHARAIQALQTTPDGRTLHLAGVMGRLPEPTAAFAREFGMPRWTTDLDVLLADPAVEAVVICSPSPIHADQTERALRAGKHVLCEIPLALSLSETDRLIDLANALDRRLMVCHIRRYLPAYVEAKRLIDTGAIHPHAIVSRYLFDRRENINWKGRQRSWTDNLLWHHGGHAVDAALWLLGVADRGDAINTVAQVALPGGNLDIPMDLTLTMRTARDQIATMTMSYHAHMAIDDCLIIGEETTVLLADRRLRDGDRVLAGPPPTDGSETPIVRQDAEFFAAIREEREPATSARSVRPAMAALQVAEDSLAARLRELGPGARHPRLP